MTCPPNKETLRPNGTKSNKAQIRRQHIFRFGGKINNARINFVLSAGMLAIEVLKLKHQTHMSSNKKNQFWTLFYVDSEKGEKRSKGDRVNMPGFPIKYIQSGRTLEKLDTKLCRGRYQMLLCYSPNCQSSSTRY